MSTADKLNALVLTKADIKLALIDKGLNPTDVFSTYADDIRAIETGGTGRDWSEIGYEAEPTYINEGVEYAKYLEELSNSNVYNNNNQYFKNNPNIIYLSNNIDWDNLEKYSGTWRSAGLLEKNINLIYVDVLDLSTTYLDINNKHIYFHPTNGLFYDCNSLKYVKKLCVFNGEQSDIAAHNLSSLLNLFAEAFYNCHSLRGIGEIVGRVFSLNSSFYGCKSLVEIPHIDTSRVTDFNSTFYGCSSLKSLDLRDWDVSNATDIYGIFYNCSKLESLDISTWDLGDLTYLMFSNCNNLKDLKLPSNITRSDMSYLFYSCSSLPEETITSLDWTKVNTLNNTFGNMNREIFDLSGIITDSFTDMSYMFSYSKTIKYIKIPNIDTSNVTNLRRIFSDCESLIAVDGIIDFIGFNDTYKGTYDVLFGYITPVIRCFTAKNLGAQSNLESAHYFRNCKNWGIPDENIEYTANARLTLTYTLSNLYDRATAGYSVCNLGLSANTKALLTEEEIAQITAKGFTIV